MDSGTLAEEVPLAPPAAAVEEAAGLEAEPEAELAMGALLLPAGADEATTGAELPAGAETAGADDPLMTGGATAEALLETIQEQ